MFIYTQERNSSLHWYIIDNKRDSGKVHQKRSYLFATSLINGENACKVWLDLYYKKPLIDEKLIMFTDEPIGKLWNLIKHKFETISGMSISAFLSSNGSEDGYKEGFEAGYAKGVSEGIKRMAKKKVSSEILKLIDNVKSKELKKAGVIDVKFKSVT